MRRFFATLTSVAGVFALAGCTGLEPAALSAGASVAQTGVTILDRGKARTVELAKYQDAVDATRRVMAKMTMTQTLEDPSPDGHRVRMSFHDDRNERVMIVIERHTDTVTLLQADVGLLGEAGIASLVLKQILAELTKAGSLPPVPMPPANQKPEPEPVVPPPPPPAPPENK
jgi:hypothetical protein